MPTEPARSTRPWIRTLWVVALAFNTLLALTPGAFAATTVSNTGGSNLQLSGSENPDQVTATVIPNPLPVPAPPFAEGYDNRALKVEDPAGAVAGPGPYCGPGPDANPNIAYCQLSQTAEFRLNGGNDTLRFTHSPPGCMEILEIYGDAGNDKILGSQCPESLLGNAGDDLLDGGAGRDKVSGDEGGRRSFTSSGRDRVYGGPGSDSLDDFEVPSPSPDTISGGSCPAGTDGFCPSPAAAELQGDRDQLAFGGTASVILDLTFQGTPGAGNPPQGQVGENNTVVSVEDATTGSGADTVKGNSAVNVISTGEGDDSVDVSGDGANSDTVDCGPGAGDFLAKDPADTALGCELPGPPGTGELPVAPGTVADGTAPAPAPSAAGAGAPGPASPGADLEVAVKVLEDGVKGGEPIFYAITIKNTGPDTAEGITLESDLDLRNLELVGTAGRDCKRSGDDLSCDSDLPTLAPGRTIQILDGIPTGTLPERVFNRVSAAKRRAGVIRKVVQVKARTADPKPANNRGSARTTVAPRKLAKHTRGGAPAQVRKEIKLDRKRFRQGEQRARGTFPPLPNPFFVSVPPPHAVAMVKG